MHNVTRQLRASELSQNRLDACFERYKQYRNRIKGPKVTITIGFINPAKTKHLELGELPSIWMACDSQSTYGEAKRVNPNKLNVIDFANGQILMAQSDSVEVGDSLTQKLKQRAKEIKMENPETAIQTVRLALLEVRQELVEWNKGVTSDVGKLFWEDHKFHVLVGYYFNGLPHLYEMGIYSGLYTEIKSFEAIGGGRSLGYFLLREYSEAIPDFDYSFPISISVVDKVTQNVDGCSPPIWTGKVFPIPFEIHSEDHKITKSTIECQAVIAGRRETDLVLEELRSAAFRESELRKDEIVNVMSRASKKYFKLRLQEQRTAAKNQKPPAGSVSKPKQ